jgi:hypothetical protein
MSDSPDEPLEIEGHRRTALLRSRQSISLPRLRCLTFTTKEIGGEVAEWVTVFLSSSLREIQFIPTTVEPLWLNVARCSTILKQISRECPNLEKLQITPGQALSYSFDPAIDDEWAPQPVTFSSIEASIHSQIGKLHNLHTLVGSPAMLHPAVFVALSKLPFLESLALRSTGNAGSHYTYALSESSFPALKHLELYKLEPGIVQELCNLQPLLKQLTKVTVFFPVHVSQYWGMSTEERFDTTIGVMARHSPHITNLTYNTEWDHSETYLSMAFVNTLQCLRLQILELECIIPTTECGWDQLLPVLPYLEELRMPVQEINLEELRLFATHLLNLRLFEFDELSLESMAIPIQDFEPLPNPSHHPVRLQGSFCFEGSITTRAKKVAK